MNAQTQDCNTLAVGPFDPDFLCVGMEKAATSWLFDQLRTHPDFWIPPVKELRYLHTATPRMDSTAKLLARVSKGRKKCLSDTDHAFLCQAEALVRQPRDIEKYAALFRFKAGRISGDISPMYCVLSGDDIRTIASRFPNLKIVLMVREPVERAWSHICQLHRMGRFDLPLLADATAFGKWFESSKLRRASVATRALQRWTEFAPSIPFRFYFFDQVASAPDLVRAEIIRFLGGDPEKQSGILAAGYNHKAGASKLPLPQSVKSVLVEQLTEEIRASARLFGGPAERWPARHGL
jgi:hypothetical protein